ncbi:alanine racemase [Salinicoccus sp. ID82-1]|uniref:Alanine racemase n=1 Tax=Salinicoccus cyprini TaxID=2493691 RepID=A0A558AZD7_9STAP|nr:MULTISPECIES: alanine racemase [Salinicoccus]MCG1009153.1 alanine racemase [Salinicoccus sp. ID82-1]TVT29597.1 alanine racemase [Salinicoccus cyprini]
MGGTLIIDRAQFIQTAKASTGGEDVIAVVKNNAYNHGLEFSVSAFLEAGIHSFATTSMDEARTIREMAPDAMIFLMNPTYDFESVRSNDFHITLPSLEYYYKYREELTGISVHLEYAGLFNRSGFEDASEMVEVINDNCALPPYNRADMAGVWTHFGYADELDMEEYEVERKMWLDLLSEVMATGRHFKYIHAQNSASFARDGLLGGHTHLRLGIALYGSRPYASLPASDYVQSMTLKASIVQLRNLSASQKCGYGGSYCPERDTMIAVVDIGYGDGILRKRAAFDCLINGRRYPIKALMMSHMIVEVDDEVTMEDEVILYGSDLRIDKFTALGVGANSEQLGALNYNSLKKVILNDTRIYQ